MMEMKDLIRNSDVLIILVPTKVFFVFFLNSIYLPW